MLVDNTGYIFQKLNWNFDENKTNFFLFTQKKKFTELSFTATIKKKQNRAQADWKK